MKALRSILVPIDFSFGSTRALETAVFFASKLEASIDVLHVWDFPLMAPASPDEPPTVSAEVSMVKATKERLDRSIRDLTTSMPLATGVQIGTVFERGDPSRAICDVARHGHYDLIVMGTHGRTGLDRMLMGSVAERVVRSASCPVLTVGREAAEKSDTER